MSWGVEVTAARLRSITDEFRQFFQPIRDLVEGGRSVLPTVDSDIQGLRISRHSPVGMPVESDRPMMGTVPNAGRVVKHHHQLVIYG